MVSRALDPTDYLLELSRGGECMFKEEGGGDYFQREAASLNNSGGIVENKRRPDNSNRKLTVTRSSVGPKPGYNEVFYPTYPEWLTHDQDLASHAHPNYNNPMFKSESTSPSVHDNVRLTHPSIKTQPGLLPLSVDYLSSVDSLPTDNVNGYRVRSNMGRAPPDNMWKPTQEITLEMSPPSHTAHQALVDPLLDRILDAFLWLLCCPFMCIYCIYRKRRSLKATHHGVDNSAYYLYPEEEGEYETSQLEVYSEEGGGEVDCYDFNLMSLQKPALRQSAKKPGTSMTQGVTKSIQLNCGDGQVSGQGMDEGLHMVAQQPGIQEGQLGKMAPHLCQSNSPAQYAQDSTDCFHSENNQKEILLPPGHTQSRQSSSSVTECFLDRYFYMINFPSAKPAHGLSLTDERNVRQQVMETFVNKHIGYKENLNKNCVNSCEINSWRDMDGVIKAFLEKEAKTAKEVAIILNGHVNR